MTIKNLEFKLNFTLKTIKTENYIMNIIILYQKQNFKV